MNKDEKYAYDGLNRLKSYDRGTLNAGDIESKVRNEAWGLDQLGNWSDYRVNSNPDEDSDYTDASDLDQDRTHNAVNEIYHATYGSAITEVGGQSAWVDPKHDSAGNMRHMPRPGDESTVAEALVCIYDAWNRVIKVYRDNGNTSGEYDANDTLIVTNSYDGRNRRIAKVVVGDGTYDFYYNNDWQLLETRKGGGANPLKQYIWDIRYVDAPVCRFRDDDTDGEDVETVYYAQDANFNVTALIDTDGSVLERYLYDPYGKVTVLNPDWSVDGDGISDYDNEILYCGYRYDPETGLYQVRYRYLHPTLGRWTTPDHIGEYTDGMSRFEYLRSSPPSYTDPLYPFGEAQGRAAAPRTGSQGEAVIQTEADDRS